MCNRLRERGHDAIHTLDLPARNRTPDADINRISVSEERVVITKDTDFVNSIILEAMPHKLLLVSTGNIGNAELERLLLANLDVVATAFASNTFVEIDRGAIRIHF
ncbi:MAG TPA: DUF5615 family PIN-like protein [Rhodothermales bacterium]|nr:DUF5615 family PIN-like protein [Rhodothermales bacterium]